MNQMLIKKTVFDFLVLKTQRSLPRIDGYGCHFLYQTKKGLGRFPVAFAKAKYAITIYQCDLNKPLS